MKSKSDSMEWIPLWIDKWIFGTTRIELEPDERSVWIDLMAVAAKDHGFIRANVGVAYPPQQLSGLLCITEELLLRAIQKCLKVGKLCECENGGGYYLPNWGEYQLSDRHKRRFEENLSGDLIKTDPNLEKILKEKIINELQERNIIFEIEKVCKTGRIDIFINSNPIEIIEIKGNEYADSIRAGIRQLLEYGIEFPQAILYLAIPNHKNLPTRIREKLKEYKINLYSCPNVGHEGQQRDTIGEDIKKRRGYKQEDRIGKERKKKILSDEEWKNEMLKLYPWINWNDLDRNIDAWLLLNPNRKKTRKLFLTFITNKIKDKPMQVNEKSHRPPQQDGTIGMPDWIEKLAKSKEI